MEELIKVIEVAAKWNKIQLPANFEKTLHKPIEKFKVSFSELLKGEYLRTTLLMVIIWYALILLYFGITLHLNNLGGDIYLNTVSKIFYFINKHTIFSIYSFQVIAGVLEAVSVCLCILVVLKLGLKINLVSYMLVAGISCLIVNFIPDGSNVGVISLAMIGMCITFCNLMMGLCVFNKVGLNIYMVSYICTFTLFIL